MGIFLAQLILIYPEDALYAMGRSRIVVCVVSGLYDACKPKISHRWALDIWFAGGGRRHMLLAGRPFCEIP